MFRQDRLRLTRAGPLRLPLGSRLYPLLAAAHPETPGTPATRGPMARVVTGALGVWLVTPEARVIPETVAQPVTLVQPVSLVPLARAAQGAVLVPLGLTPP